MRALLYLIVSSLSVLIFGACSTGDLSSRKFGPPNMGGPSTEERKAQIASEQTGNFYYGRRYYVEKTRFWGYLRKPRQSANSSQLVIFNESKKRTPDRFSETGSGNQRYGYDQNYEYQITLIPGVSLLLLVNQTTISQPKSWLSLVMISLLFWKKSLYC